MKPAELPPVARRRSLQREEARRAILDASEAILLEEGYEAFSIRRLAVRCGYTAPTIYYYFGDKPGILDALLEERCQRLVRALRRVPHSRDLLGHAHALYGAFVRFGRSNPTHYRLLTARRDPGTPRPPSFDEARALLERPLHELAAQGQLAASTVDTVAHAVFALLHGLVSLGNDRPDLPWPPNLVNAALDALLRGFVAETAARAPAGAGT